MYPRKPLKKKNRGEIFIKKITIKELVTFSLVTALYVALTLIFSGISFGGIQFRIAESLTLLCFYNKRYIYPLTLGCFIVNLFSPFMIFDIIFGTIATFLSLFLMRYAKNIYIAALFPIFINAFIVGIELKLLLGLPLFISIFQVAFGQFVCIFILGIIMIKAIAKNKKVFASLFLYEKKVD